MAEEGVNKAAGTEPLEGVGGMRQGCGPEHRPCHSTRCCSPKPGGLCCLSDSPTTSKTSFYPVSSVPRGPVFQAHETPSGRDIATRLACRPCYQPACTSASRKHKTTKLDSFLEN